MELKKSIRNKSIIILSLVLVLFFFCIDSVHAETTEHQLVNSSNWSQVMDLINTELQNRNITTYDYLFLNWTDQDIAVFYFSLEPKDYWTAADFRGSPAFYENHVIYFMFDGTTERITSSDLTDRSGRVNLPLPTGLIASSKDVMYDGEIYLKKKNLLNPVEIPEITQVEELPKTMGKVLKILIPVGLVGCGIFLLVLLMRRVLLRLS